MSFGKDLLDKIKTNRDKSANDIIKEQTEGSIVGASIGLLVGLYIGYSRKYNMLVSGFLGAAIGGLVTKRLIKPKD